VSTDAITWPVWAKVDGSGLQFGGHAGKPRIKLEITEMPGVAKAIEGAGGLPPQMLDLVKTGKVEISGMVTVATLAANAETHQFGHHP
jgi:hypothetical protein